MTVRGSAGQNLDVMHHLKQARKSILFGRGALLKDHLQYFDAVVSDAACFVSGHRKFHKRLLHTIDVSLKKLCEHIVSPPPGTNC